MAFWSYISLRHDLRAVRAVKSQDQPPQRSSFSSRQGWWLDELRHVDRVLVTIDRSARHSAAIRDADQDGVNVNEILDVTGLEV